MGACKEAMIGAAEAVAREPERAAALLVRAAFIIESVAHLCRMERDLLPVSDDIRALTRTGEFREERGDASPT